MKINVAFLILFDRSVEIIDRVICELSSTMFIGRNSYYSKMRKVLALATFVVAVSRNFLRTNYPRVTFSIVIDRSIDLAYPALSICPVC